MNILLLCRYGDLGASSRLRFFQYLKILRYQGFEVEVNPLFSNAYLERLYIGKQQLRLVLKCYLGRLVALSKAHKYDLLIIEKEIFPYLPAWFEQLLAWCKIKYLVDYDDATFHSYDHHPRLMVRALLRKKIDFVMKNSAMVIAGNYYIANRAREASARHVEVIPTVVDTDRYMPAEKTEHSVPIVGWIGTPITSRYLQNLLPVFEKLSQKTSVRFVAIGANKNDFTGTVVEVWPWSEESEGSLIQKFDIGVMPLTDSPWERGKCGYKLIQYMACAKPVVASPVGANCQIVDHGVNGYLATSQEDWYSYLLSLVRGNASCFKMGRSGRQKVLDHYSLESQASRVVGLIKEVVNSGQ